MKASLLLILISALIFGVEPSKSQSINQNQKREKLTVAIYPYLPRSDQFISVLSESWKRLNTGIDLQFADYNCYESDPPDSLDVFVFDGVYYSYFISEKFLQPLSIDDVQNWDGFMDYAKDAVKLDDNIYGLPYLGCSDVYFYRKSDIELNSLPRDGIDAFYSVIGDCSNPSSSQPPPRKGLLIDLSSGTTDACYYIKGEMNLDKRYSKNPILPSVNEINPQVVHYLNLFTRMAGNAQATYEDPGTQRIEWFTQGYGRALVGITENLCSFPRGYLDSVAFRLLPTVNSNLPATQEFYVDIASISSKVSKEKYPYAIKLLNLMCSSTVMYNSMIPTKPNQNPQFLMPARGDVLADLMDIHPLYINMAALLLRYNPEPLLFGEKSKEWLKGSKGDIKKEILSK
jgi:thiamine pyridinylase